MLGVIHKRKQKELFRTYTKDCIDLRHPLCVLANQIDWSFF